jgi:hypothetical protein
MLRRAGCFGFGLRRLFRRTGSPRALLFRDGLRRLLLLLHLPPAGIVQRLLERLPAVRVGLRSRVSGPGLASRFNHADILNRGTRHNRHP